MSSAWKDGLFANKVVFCTGGSGDICSGQVRALVALGAQACIIGRNKAKAERVAHDIALVRSGSMVLGLGNVDVRSYEEVCKAVQVCIERFGAIDFVIAGAAGNFVASVDNLSVNAFKSVVDIDLIGSFITAKATLPHLVESAQRAQNGPGGRIIFVSSTNYHCVRLSQSHVCAAKAGINALSDCISLEYGPRGVTSNIISPGPIGGTEGEKRLVATRAAVKQRFIESIPLQRMGTVMNVADATVFLCAETGSFVTGTRIDVDGGAWRTRAAGAGEGYWEEFGPSRGEGEQKAKL